MKKFSLLLIFALSVFATLPSSAKEKPKESAYVSSEVNPSEAAEALVLTARLDEINMMNKEGMTRKEKRELRKEVNTIKAKLAASGGVYLSIGALLLVVILLIILL